MGYPGQRMPVANVKLSESPNYTLKRQTVFDVPIFSYVADIVIVDEVKPLNLPIDRKRRDNK